MNADKPGFPWLRLLLVLLIFMFTYPQRLPIFRTGLDGSYVWALNHLAIHDFDQLRNLLFAFGPLGFLKKPIAEGFNFWWSTLCFSGLKLSYIWLFLTLAHIASPGRWRFSYILLALFTSYYMAFDHAFLGSIVLAICLYLQTKKIPYMLWVAVLSAFGLYIKPALAVYGLAALGAGTLLDLYLNRDWKSTTSYLAGLVLSMAIIGLLVYQSFGKLLAYWSNSVELVMSYSSAVALFPETSGWMLLAFALSVLVVPFVIKDKDARIAWAIMILPLFAAWKHGITRQDSSHCLALFYFVILAWAIIFISAKRRSIAMYLLPVLSILLLRDNFNRIDGFRGFDRGGAGFKYFSAVFFHPAKFHREHAKINQDRLSIERLPEKFLVEIGEEQVDIIPWKLAIVAANDLQWKPRTRLQSWSFNEAYDQDEADSFASGPTFLLQHLMIDQYGGSFAAIDDGYFWSSLPRANLAILKHYRPVLQDHQYILWKKLPKANTFVETAAIEQAGAWGEWMDVPKNSRDLIWVKVASSHNLLGGLQSFLFKAAPYYIDYRFEDGAERTYRYIPENAVDGLWISPWLDELQSPFSGAAVTQIRLRTETSLQAGSPKLQFKTITLGEAEDSFTEAILGKGLSAENQIIGSADFNFEPGGLNNVSRSVKGEAHSGSFAHLVGPGMYSHTFELSLDSLWASTGAEKILVDSRLFYKGGEAHDVIHVCTLKDGLGGFWNQSLINANNDDWNASRQSMLLDRAEHRSGLIQAYVWNQSKSVKLIDDWKLRVYGY